MVWAMAETTDNPDTGLVLQVHLVGDGDGGTEVCQRELPRRCSVGELTPGQLHAALVPQSSPSPSQEDPVSQTLASNPVVLDVVGNDWATSPWKWAGTAPETTKTPLLRGFLTVELRGIEPLTSSMPSKRSAN